MSVLLAQTPSEDDIPIELRQIRNYTFSFGARTAPGGGGVKVSFGKLGAIPQISTFDATSAITRQYDDGAVVLDAVRTAESGVTVTNGRYITTSAGQVVVTNLDGTTTTTDVTNTVDNLAYVAGQTRIWGFANASQITTEGIRMNSYSAVTRGGTAEAESSGGGGLDFAVSRTVRRFGKASELSIKILGGITDINAKTRGTVVSTLHRQTDIYKLLGTLPTDTTSYSAPVYGTAVTNLDGSTTTTETTVPLQLVPLRREEADVSATTVDGYWQIKGATYALRVGPEFRSYLSERWAFSGGLGASVHYIGARYLAEESITVEGISSPISIEAEQTDSAVSFGFYADANVEFWPSDRTGFYLGAAYESMTKDFEMALASRTAAIKVGNGVAFRLGIITRF